MEAHFKEPFAQHQSLGPNLLDYLAWRRAVTLHRLSMPICTVSFHHFESSVKPIQAVHEKTLQRLGIVEGDHVFKTCKKSVNQTI